MKKAFILLLQIFAFYQAISQSFSIDELMKLANMPSKNIDHYMIKKGFILFDSKSDSAVMSANFIEKSKYSRKNFGPKRSIDIFIKGDCKNFTLHTPQANEFKEGEQKLIKSGFFYDKQKDLDKEHSILFQKGNITVVAKSEVQDSTPIYSFDLKQKVIPSSLMYAEDLLQFDSHEFLVSFFGEQNVKKDMYYLTETELKKCSVLFSGTPRQAVFVWGDETYLNNLSYVLITNVLPTQNGRKNDPLSGNNEWQLKNGIYPGMELKDLLKINEVDFDIYGNKSELAFLAKPNEYCKIDFKKIAIMFSCHECIENKLFNQKEVSALAVAKANISMKVFDVALYPSHTE